jgi:hypothetical protein
MARLEQGILGGIRGKIGNVVGSAWKGIAVIKTKPLSVANPQTAGQVAQRTKFTNVVAFARIILAGIIKPLWDRFQTGQSGFNAFISENIALFAAEMPSPTPNLKISVGKMEKTDISSMVTADGSANVTVNWVDDSGEGYKLATDEAYIVCFNDTTEEVIFESGDAVRSDTTAQLSFSANCNAGENVRAYLAFKRADGTVVSNTDYLNDLVA